MKKSIWIVTARYGTDLEIPCVFRTEKEASAYAKSYIIDGALYAYDGDIEEPSFSDLEIWAEDNGYDLSETYFWDGGSDAYEALVTCADLPW